MYVSRMLVAVACASAMAVLSGCGKSAQEKAVEKNIEAATGKDADVSISQEGMKLSMQVDGGKVDLSSGDQAKLPSDFPKDIPLYSNAKLMVAMKTPNGFSLSFQTDDDPGKVIEEMKKNLTGKSWKEMQFMAMGPQKMAVFQKETRNVAITAAQDPNGNGKVMLTIIVSDNK